MCALNFTCVRFSYILLGMDITDYTSSDFRRAVGHRLKVRLFDKGISVADAANAIGLSRTTMSRKLNPARNVTFTVDEYARLCDLIDSSADDIFQEAKQSLSN